MVPRSGFVLLVAVEADVGGVIAQAIGRRLLIANAMIQPQGSPGGICSGQSGHWTGFSPSA